MNIVFKKIFSPIFYINNWWLYYLELLHFFKDGNILYKLRNGTKLYAVSNSFDSRIINEIWGEKVYALDFFSLENSKVIVDIGAHKGYFSLFIASKLNKKGKIFSVEPFRENYTLLEENIKINKIKNIKIFPYGISNKKEKRKLYAPSSSAAGVSMIKDWFVAEPNVLTLNMQCITLDDLMKKEKIKTIDLLKMDIEGGEHSILSALSSSTYKKIKNITMEYHQIGLLRVDKIIKILKKQGFSVHTVPMGNTLGMLYAKRI